MNAPTLARAPRGSRGIRRLAGGSLFLVILGLAAVLRLYHLDRLPPGLFIDQAQYGLDAYRISRGETFPVFVEGPGGIKARGREPLFMVLMAGLFRLFGPTPTTIKLTSALIGILTVAVTYAAARRWLGERIGVLAAAVVAVSSWHVTFSRMGFRAILAPLWVSLVALALWHALERRSVGTAALFGAVLGAGFYTYPAYWSVPPALALVLAVGLWERRARPTPPAAGLAEFAPADASHRWRERALAAAVTCAVVMAPLLLFAATHADDLLARAREVAVVGGQQRATPAEGETTLLDGLQRVLFMLHLRGDQEVRHNLPGRPMLDLVSGLAFVVGLIVLLRSRRPRSLKIGLVALWLLLLLPSAVTQAAPNALRAVGAIPAVCAIVAIGLDAGTRLIERLPGRAGRVAAYGFLSIALAAVTVANVRAYFVDWAAQPTLGTEFSADIPRFVDYLGELAADAELVVCPYVYSSPNVHFLVLRQDPPFIPFDSVEALLANASGRDRVFVCDDSAVNALLQRLYPTAEEVGRYAIYSMRTGRVTRVAAGQLRLDLPPPEEELARHFVSRMQAAFAEQSRAW